MDRTRIAFLTFSLVICTVILSLDTASTTAASKVADKDLPYSMFAVQVVVADVADAVEYCESLSTGKLTGFMGQVVSDVAEEFESIDKTHPMRIELCLDPKTSSAVQLIAITAEAETLAKTFDIELSDVPGQTNMFELVDGERSENQTDRAYLRTENGRSYMVISESELTPETADRILTRLKRDDKRNSKYQWSISSRPCEIAPSMRKMMLTQLTKATAVQLQQRDGEDDVSYQLRSLWGKTKLQILNTFAADCEYVEAGFKVLPDEGRGTMELTFKARENSTLDRWMTKTGKANSPFAGMLQDEDRTSVALSFELGETQKDSAKKLTAATNSYLEKSHNLSASHAKAFSSTMNEQLKRGHAHAILQINQLSLTSPCDSLAGGISLKNGERVAPVLNHVMQIIARGNPAVLIGEANDDQPAVHLWNNPFDISESSTVAITANSNGIWFAFGVESGTRDSNDNAQGASERLAHLIQDVKQSRQSRERSFLLQTFVSKQVWSTMNLYSQIESKPTTITETYEVQVTNADGTTSTEERVRTYTTQKNGLVTSTSVAEGTANQVATPVATEKPNANDTKIQQVAAATDAKNVANRPYAGQFRLYTESIKNGLRIHGEFEQDSVAAMMLFPEFVGAMAEMVGLE